MAYAGWPSSLCPSSPIRTWSREDLPLPELSTYGRGSASMSPEDPMGGGGGGQQALCAVFGGGGTARCGALRSPLSVGGIEEEGAGAGH